MTDPRLTSAGLFYSETIEGGRYIYAIGGNKSKRCERYSVNDNEWEQIPNFQEMVQPDPEGEFNYLFTYSMCASNMI